MAYQSLYRRYRSRTFDELVGQQHVVTALKNAITEGRVGHAYLFSGPRGTGKTSTARILGKALNCTNRRDDGEPCCECDSCLAFEAGTSYDLQELDAASNNGVEAIRDLISKVALGSPGQTKVYILDEVHMLTAGAENALLKTLEEPPDHVIFVLATTEPHKVVPTIRSRTQHFEFELIPADELERHVRWVAADAGLDIDEAMIGHVLRVGGGSARDTLSALDQVVAAGGVPRDGDVIELVLEGLAAADAGRVVVSVSEALRAGRDPRVIGEALLARLRDAFLSAMGAPLGHLSDAQETGASDVAERMGPAAITRALEVLGSALIDMRQAPDPRVDLEVALLRLARPELDTDLASVVVRLERLEQGGATTPPPAPAAAPAPAPAGTAAPAADEPEAHTEAAPAEPAPPPSGARPADGARAALKGQRGSDSGGSTPRPTLGARRGSAPTAPQSEPPVAAAEAATDEPAPESAADTDEPPAPAAPSTTGGPTLEQLEQSWDDIRAALPGRAKSRFSGGRFIRSDADGAVFGLPNAIHRDRCQECVGDVEAALSSHFGAPVSVALVVDGDAVPPAARAPEPSAKPAEPAPKADDEAVDLTALTDAAPDAAGGVELLTDAFPGAEIVEEPHVDG